MAKYLIDSNDILIEEIPNTDNIKLNLVKKTATLTGTITNNNSSGNHEVALELNYPEGFDENNCVVIGGLLGASSIPRWAFSSVDGSCSYYVYTALDIDKLMLFYYDISATTEHPITMNYKITLMKIS